MPAVPKEAAITAADTALSAIRQSMWATLIRQSVTYSRGPGLFDNLEATLAGVDGTVKAQQLNAALDIIDGIGPGMIRIEGGDDAEHYSQDLERASLVDYALAVLYPGVSIGKVGARRVTTVVENRVQW
jgi:hypothetical protein